MHNYEGLVWARSNKNSAGNVDALEVLDAVAVAGPGHHHRVEAYRQVVAAVTAYQKVERCQPQAGPLAGVDALGRGAKAQLSALAHFDEHHGAASLYDQVDLATAGGVVFTEQEVTFGKQIVSGNCLGPVAHAPVWRL